MSVRVDAGSRTVYLDLKDNPDGSRFLSISELKRDHGDGRSRILIDEQYLPDLLRALSTVLHFLRPNSGAKTYTLEEKRRVHPNAYQPWTKEEDRRPKAEYTQGLTVEQLAGSHGRAPTAIRSRLERLGLAASRVVE